MISNRPMKEIAKIGKGNLVRIVGLCQNYKTKIDVEEIDYAACPKTCPFSDKSVAERKEYCFNYCPNPPKKKPLITYTNEKHKYKITTNDQLEEKRLSKYQLLQFLLYHFMNVDSNGLVTYISIKEIAKIIGCDTRTIKNNNLALIDLGLIAYTKVTKDLFSIAILGYKKYHLTRKEGGTGYIQMPKEFLEELLQIKNVNSIRLAIRQLIKFDDESVKETDDKCFYTYEDIKRFMPSNVSYKSIIKETLSGTAKLFNVELYDSHVIFNLKDEFNGKKLRQIKENNIREIITNFYKENVLYLDKNEKDIEDLIQLSMEYGITYVNEALVIYLDLIKVKDEPLDNVGGFIRTVIKDNLLKKAVA